MSCILYFDNFSICLGLDLLGSFVSYFLLRNLSQKKDMLELIRTLPWLYFTNPHGFKSRSLVSSNLICPRNRLGAFGPFKVNVGLFLGFVASALACTMESIGDYAMCARISEERHPPIANTNRAIFCEGFGACLAAVMGVGAGITTYAECIALMSVTRVSRTYMLVSLLLQVTSRVTMQMAGVLLILLGLFTKCAAVLATIPEAIVGGVLAMGMTMICGVALSNLHVCFSYFI